MALPTIKINQILPPNGQDLKVSVTYSRATSVFIRLSSAEQRTEQVAYSEDTAVITMDFLSIDPDVYAITATAYNSEGSVRANATSATTITILGFYCDANIPDGNIVVPEYPPKDQFVRNFCDGTTKMAEYHDGNGGFYTVVVALNSTDCGWKPPVEPEIPVDPNPPVPTGKPPVDNYTGVVSETMYFGRKPIN